jgi:hypothetical protein
MVIENLERQKAANAQRDGRQRKRRAKPQQEALPTLDKPADTKDGGQAQQAQRGRKHQDVVVVCGHR